MQMVHNAELEELDDNYSFSSYATAPPPILWPVAHELEQSKVRRKTKAERIQLITSIGGELWPEQLCY
jgi:hypothetical protein